MTSLLEVRDLDFAYGDVQVLRGVSLSVNAGEIVTLVGSNGAGKSTTLRNISRLLRPRAGSIVFDGHDLTKLSSHQVVELGVVQVPEGRRVFPEMTVLENLRMGSYIKSARADRQQNLERGLTLFPRLKERIGAARRDALRRRAADARDRARPDGQSPAADPRRAVARAFAAAGADDLRHHRADQQPGHLGAAGGAERLPVAAHRGARDTCWKSVGSRFPGRAPTCSPTTR